MRQLKITKQTTNRDQASLDKYLQDISKIELLTADEEVALAQRIKMGDSLALEKLTKANLRFVVSVSKQYQNQGLSLPDLINEGNLGLIKAAQKFDETRGFKFISYAVWWIRQGILQAIAEQSKTVRLPMNIKASINQYNKAKSKLTQELEREPSEEEIMKYLSGKGVDKPKTIISNHSFQNFYISTDAQLTDRNNSATTDTFGDQLINEETESNPTFKLEQESLSDQIDILLSNYLTSREFEIIKLFYGLGGVTPMTLKEIGDRFDLTRERVRQIKAKAISRLKRGGRANILKQFL